MSNRDGGSDADADSGPGTDGADGASASATHALTANDVSVLFPLASDSPTTLWPATLAGKGGPLLPSDVFAKIGMQLLSSPAPLAGATEYGLLRVVAVRFDPCFATACQPQVRLVLQGFQADGSVYDGAVHLLYDLTSADFAAMLAELRALTAQAPENLPTLPLGPSPALGAQGVTGAYGQGLRAVLTRYAGAGNLARMTFITRQLAGDPLWKLGGFNLRDFTPTGAIAIAGLPNNTLSEEITLATPAIDYNYVIAPRPTAVPAIVPVLVATQVAALSADTRAAAYDTLVKIENPTLVNPDNVDCASCHVTNRIRGFFDQNFPPAQAPASLYSGSAEAARTIGAADTDPENVRAFGWFRRINDSTPSAAVSQRTANETNHVLTLLSTM